MFQPSFEKGSILKQHMLEALRDNPCLFSNLQYATFGDGLICGFDISIFEDRFVVAPGIIRQNGVLYASTDALTLEQIPGKHYVYLSVKCEKKPDGKDILVHLEQYDTPKENSTELFRYTKNANLSHFRKIQELGADTINRIDMSHSLWSVQGGTTLYGMYFKLYANEVLGSINATPADIAFAYQCLNGIRDISVIKQYFQVDDQISNDAIISRMMQKLNTLEQKQETVRAQKEPEAPMQIIVS